MRLLSADASVVPLLWFVLIAGGVITVVFSFSLGVEQARCQIILTMATASMIGLTLYLIFAIDHPFRGGIRLGPKGLQLVLENYPDPGPAYFHGKR